MSVKSTCGMCIPPVVVAEDVDFWTAVAAGREHVDSVHNSLFPASDLESPISSTEEQP